MTKYIARNTVTNKSWDGQGFNIHPAFPEQAALLTEVQAIVVRHTYLNVAVVPVTLEPSTEEVAASDAFFLQCVKA